nr:hypothetical protein [Nitrospira japonica]
MRMLDFLNGRAYRAIQFVHGFFLYDCLRTKLEHRIAILIRIGRQTEDGYMGKVEFDVPRRLDPVHPGHVDIHHDDIRKEIFRKGSGFRPINRFTDHPQVCLIRKHATDDHSHHRIIFSHH